MPKKLSIDEIIAGSGAPWPLETSRECRDAIAQLDIEIGDISEQLALDDHEPGNRPPEWRLRAEKACYFKRQARHHLIARLGDLKRAERAAAHEEHQQRQRSGFQTKAQLFIQAAREMLSEDDYQALWRRTDELMAPTGRGRDGQGGEEG